MKKLLFVPLLFAMAATLWYCQKTPTPNDPMSNLSNSTSDRGESSSFCAELPNCGGWQVQVLETFPAGSQYYVQIDAFEAPVCADDFCDNGLTNQCCVTAFKSSGYTWPIVPTNGCFGSNPPILDIGQFMNLPWFYTRKYVISLLMKDAAGNTLYYNPQNPNSAFVRLRFLRKGALDCGLGNYPSSIVTINPSNTASGDDSPCLALFSLNCCTGLSVQSCE